MPDGNSSDIVEKGIKEHCSYTCKGADCFVYLYLYAALGGACRNTENGSTALFLCKTTTRIIKKTITIWAV